MPLSAVTIAARVRRQLAEPNIDRFLTAAEIYEWLNDTLREMSAKAKFLKKHVTVLETSYITALGTDPKYFECPSDFICIDKDLGILQNGVRRLPTTDRELYAFQPQEYSTNISGSAVLFDAVSLSENFNFFYSVDYLFKDEMDAARTGILMWFLPSPAVGDSYILNYVARHPTVSSATFTIFMSETDESALVYGTCIYALDKMIAAGRPGAQAAADRFEKRWDEKFGDMRKRFSVEEKVPDKNFAIRSPRQLGYYNSARRRRGAGRFTATE